MLKSGLTDRVEQERVLDFKFLDPGKLSPPVLQCNNITFGYPGAEILYSGVDFGVDLDSRVALVGPNGAGECLQLLVLLLLCMPYMPPYICIDIVSIICLHTRIHITSDLVFTYTPDKFGIYTTPM